MSETIRAVTWEAPEHHHIEKNGDWFWALWIIAFAAAAAAFFFGNYLFAILIVIGAAAMALVANQQPKIVPFAVTTRGLRINNTLFPYSTLEAFYIDEDHFRGPQLLAKSQKLFMPLIIMPLPEEYLDDIEDIISVRLPEEEMEEPFANKLLELFGF